MRSAIPIFHGRISKDGRFELAPDEADLRRRYFRTLAGDDVEITVRKARTQRSLDQNAYLHGVPFPILQEALGYESVEELKLALMGEKWGYHRDPVSGKELPIKPSTSSMTVDECREFIEWLPVWAATTFPERGIVIPLPNEAEAA